MQQPHWRHSSQSGYTALSSLLVIGAVMLIIGVGITVMSIDEMQSSLSISQADRVRFLAESCVEDALLSLNKNNALPTTIVLSDATCDVSVIAQVGNEWNFQVSVSNNQYQKTFQVLAQRGMTVTVEQWRELE